MGTSAQPHHATATNTVAETGEITLQFVELTEFADRPDSPLVSISTIPEAGTFGALTEGDTLDFGPIRSDDRHEKWLYVFRRRIHANGQVARASDGTEWISICAEIQYDEDGRTSLVDWAENAWVGRDDRPATVEWDELVFDWAPARSELWACLSHVQLPRRRIEAYLANENGLLENRCQEVLLTPFTAFSRDEGGWYIPVIDFAHLAEQVHVAYEAAVHLARSRSIQNATEVFHAGLFRAVAEAYKQQEEEEHAPGRILDRITPFLDDYRREQDRLRADMELWGRFLYEGILTHPTFETAREDASAYASTIDDLSDDQVDAVESEVLRQMELLVAAGDTETGLDYLKTYLAAGLDDTTNWYERVALATKLTSRLSQIPEAFLERLHEKAEVTARNSEEALRDLRARRVRANGLLLEHLETVRLRVSGERRTAVERRQVRILEPLYRGVSAGHDIVLPGDPEFERTRDQMLSRNRGGTESTLDAQFREGTVPEHRLRAYQILLADPDATLHRDRLSSLRLTAVDPQAAVLAAAGHPGVPARSHLQSFTYETTESGLIVATHRNYAVLADASDVLVTSPPATGPPAPGRLRDAYVAGLRRLAPLPASGEHRQSVDELTRLIVEESETVTQNSIAAELRARQLNYAGRFLLALDILDVATGIPDFIDKIRAGDRQQRRGRSWWASYQGAVSSGLGLGGAVASSVEGLEHLLPRTALRTGTGQATRIAIGLRVVGVVGAILGGAAAAITWHSEAEQHDAWGATSAGLAFGASVLALLSIVTSSSILGPIAIVVGIVSVIVFLFADTKLEELLRNSAWSEDEQSEVEALSNSDRRSRLHGELVDLLQLLSRPQLSVDLLDSDGSLSTYAHTMRPPPAYLRLTVRPGFHPPGTTYEITGFTIEHATGSPEPVEADALQVPDPAYDLILVESDDTGDERHTRGFIRQWRIDGLGLSQQTRDLLRMPAAGFTFQADVRVRIQEADPSRDLDQTFRLRGPVGYNRNGRIFPSRTTSVAPRP